MLAAVRRSPASAACCERVAEVFAYLRDIHRLPDRVWWDAGNGRMCLHFGGGARHGVIAVDDEGVINARFVEQRSARRSWWVPPETEIGADLSLWSLVDAVHGIALPSWDD